MSRQPTQRRLARLVLCIGVATSMTWACATTASASFGAFQLQSASIFEQFEEAGEPAISANGQYLAFQGTVGGTRGIWRKDLATGKLELVIGGSIYDAPGSLTEASAPSISEDGRYVSFTAESTLVKTAHAGSNVYVRDMSLPAPPGSTCTESEEEDKRCPYELASALNGSSEGLSYKGGGAVASGRVALSANGREIAFVVEGESDLASESATELTTPPLQVLVRNLETDATTLVSAEREPSSQELSEKGRCLGEGSGEAAACPVQGGAVTPSTELGTRKFSFTPPLPGAALSGDGSTIAWLGANIPEQAPTLKGEREQIEADDARPEEAYDEPLWRRIGDGPSAPTRRMIGGGDPLAPGCPPNGTIQVAACRGPFPELQGLGDDMESNYGWLVINEYDGVPQLSYDGWTAAVIGDPSSTSNVFVVDMSEELDRVQAVRQLTREVPVPGDPNPAAASLEHLATAGDIYEIAISPDGSRIAFTTQRDLFPLAPPNATEPPLAQLGVVELYEINLSQESLVRVTHGPDGGPGLEGRGNATASNRGAATPSFTRDGLTLAFADTASNLVYGDANNASDVFTVTQEEGSDLPGPVEIGAAPAPQEPTKPRWMLGVVPVLHSNGSVTLEVAVPGAGELTASASAVVPVYTRAAARGGQRVAQMTSKRRSSSRKRSNAATKVRLQTRLVATARMPAGAAGVLELPLHVSKPYAGLLQTTSGIYATVQVRFDGRGGPPLMQKIQIMLRDRKPRRSSSKQELQVPKRKSKHGTGDKPS